MMRTKEGRISAVTLIRIDSERYILININGTDGFSILYIPFLIVLQSRYVTVGLLTLFLDWSGSWRTTSGTLKIRANRMSSNALLSNFTVQMYLSIFFFSFVCPALEGLVLILCCMNQKYWNSVRWVLRISTFNYDQYFNIICHIAINRAKYGFHVFRVVKIDVVSASGRSFFLLWNWTSSWQIWVRSPFPFI